GLGTAADGGPPRGRLSPAPAEDGSVIADSEEEVTRPGSDRVQRPHISTVGSLPLVALAEQDQSMAPLVAYCDQVFMVVASDGLQGEVPCILALPASPIMMEDDVVAHDP